MVLEILVHVFCELDSTCIFSVLSVIKVGCNSSEETIKFRLLISIDSDDVNVICSSDINEKVSFWNKNYII